MKFYVRSSCALYDETIRIVYGDFVTESVNPVVCIPADTRPIGGLAKYFMREYKPEEGIFSQRLWPGDVAYITPANPDPHAYVFFCITPAVAKEDSNPELLYRCLGVLRAIAYGLCFKTYSFPLLDWDRDFLTLRRFYKLLQIVFEGSGVAVRLYPHYYLSIR